MEKKSAILKFIALSLFGIFMFFIAIEFNGRKTIPVDHIVKTILAIPHVINWYGTVIICLGVMIPLITGTWRKNLLSKIFTVINVAGLLFTLMVVFHFGPEIVTQESIGPFIFNKVVVPVVTIVPVGSIFLSFLVSYGLMESIGTIMEPAMKRLFKTPGRSAIDAVASFVGSYSLALLVTNRVYKENKYTFQEAAIIATGFSTVSATFMIIAANTLGLMDYWFLYFWVCLAVTFIVTAITARIYPLSKLPQTYYDPAYEKPINDEEKVDYNRNIFIRAWNVGIKNAENSGKIWNNVISNLKDGTKLAINIGPAIMSIGVISLVLSQYTNLFDIAAYIFYPITKVLGAQEPLLIAKGAAVTIADMYVPAILSVDADIITKFIIGVICISEILFLSASIPCILATEIPIRVKDIIIIWFERVIFSLLLVIPFAYFVLPNFLQ